MRSLEFGSNCGMTVHLSLTPHLIGSQPRISGHPSPDFANTFSTFPPKTGRFKRQLGREMCNFLSAPQQQQRMVPYTQSTGAYPALLAQSQPRTRSGSLETKFTPGRTFSRNFQSENSLASHACSSLKDKHLFRQLDSASKMAT